MEPEINLESNIDNSSPATQVLPLRAVGAIVLISVICGAVGGVLGTSYFNNPPQFLNTQNVYVEESAVIDVVKQTSPAVVSIVVSRDLSRLPGFGLNPLDPFFGFVQPNQNQNSPNIQQIGAGSGFFVSSDGLILTNRHVVSDQQASYSVVTADGQSYEAQIMARDPVNDLAILKIDIKNAPALALADSNHLQIGQQVVAIGNSLGQYQNTVTSGIVSGIGRSIVAGGSTGSEQLEGVIQTDAAINPGNSGGPLLNLAGQVIGINTAIDAQGQLVGFAIPANDATKALTSFEKTGKIQRPFLGVRYVLITKALAEQERLPRDHGALIVRGQGTSSFAIAPGSPAERAGLVVDDIILEVNGHRIDETNSLARELKNYDVGQTVTLKIYHQGTEKTVTVTLGETP